MTTPAVRPPSGSTAEVRWSAGSALNGEHETRAYRGIDGPERLITDTDASVISHAFQFSDGSLDEPVVFAFGGSNPLNSDQARELAAALLEAAAEIESWVSAAEGR